MKPLKSILPIALCAFFALSALAHNGNRVDIESDFTEGKAGQIQYTFQLVDEKLRKPVSDSELEVVHEKNCN